MDPGLILVCFSTPFDQCREADNYIGRRQYSESWTLINRVKANEKTNNSIQLIQAQETRNPDRHRKAKMLKNELKNRKSPR